MYFVAVIAHIIHFILRNVFLSKEFDIEMYKSLELKYLKMNILNLYYHDIHFSYNIIHLQIWALAIHRFDCTARIHFHGMQTVDIFRIASTTILEN